MLFTMPIDAISKEMFCKYEAFRETGIANMLDMDAVSAYTHLSRDTISLINCNYDKLNKRHRDDECIQHYKEVISDKTVQIQDTLMQPI